MSNIDVMHDSPAQEPNRGRTGCLIVLMNLFFVTFFLWGIDEAYSAWQLQTNGVITQGSVVRFDEEYSEGDCCVYRPVIEFKVNERVYTFKGNYASSQPGYPVGARVNVRYDPADPNVAQIDSYLERWIIPAVVLPAATAVTLAANFFMLRKWRLAKPIGE